MANQYGFDFLKTEHLDESALEDAKVFKKQTLKVKRDMRFKNNKLIAIGTAGAAAGGLVLGSIIGGPIGAAVLTPIFAAGFLGASGAMKDWGLSQKFVVMTNPKQSGGAPAGGSATSSSSSSNPFKRKSSR